MTGKRPMKLRQASSYFRLAAKADRARQSAQAARYRDRAERLVRENRRDQEFINRMKERQK